MPGSFVITDVCRIVSGANRARRGRDQVRSAMKNELGIKHS